MDTYNDVSYDHARSLTLKYSSSFSSASRLFSPALRKHVYAVYGLVRIADEIVDTYQGLDAARLLADLERETYAAILRGYSTNTIVHAFALTAAAYSIDTHIIAPFFKSMRMDLSPQLFTSKSYNEYIHGSAEVVGLMCLKIFCGTDHTRYRKLESGAEALGAAYQKVNFLRDMAEDFTRLGRTYFPGINFHTFSDADKLAIIEDIERDFAHALPDIKRLPSSCRGAVETSYRYYSELLAKLKITPAETIKTTRIRVPTVRKLQLFAVAAARQKLKR